MGWFLFLRTSAVRTVEARQAVSDRRWRWYGLDETNSVVAQCAGNWENWQGAMAAGRAVFPRAFQRIREA